jgi:PAP2 superfamily
MKYKLATTLVVVVALAVATLSTATTTRPAQAQAASGTIPVKGCPENPNKPPPCDGDDAILKWNEELLASIRADPPGTGPTISARALGVLHTATYDAWEAYDPIAKSTRPNGNPERPANNANKSKAISFAAYKTLVDLFPKRQSFFAARMTELGYPNFATDTSTEASIGNAAAAAVLTYRHADGSNQTNNSDGTVTYPCSKTGPCYYQPTKQWYEPTEAWRWQPLCVPLSATCKPVNPTGPNPQAPLTPQWANVIPFASSPAQYKVMGPPRNPDGTFSNKDVATALTDTSNLDDFKKTVAEYWADGPQTEFPPGHTAVFGQAISRKNHLSLDANVKMFFALGNALLDASIGAWWTKYKDKWDFWRPITAIRHVYATQDVNSWRGPGADPAFGTVKGKDWIPYQALNVVTPPFPEYVSGHSTFTAAGSIVLMSATGSDTFGGTVTIEPGTSKIDPGVTPAEPVTLTWSTFTAAADQAGLSRRYGGIHFVSGDMHGRALGNLLGRGAYAKAQSFIQGRIGS